MRFYDIDAGSVVSWNNLRTISDERWLGDNSASILFSKCIIQKIKLANHCLERGGGANLCLGGGDSGFPHLCSDFMIRTKYIL